MQHVVSSSSSGLVVVSTLKLVFLHSPEYDQIKLYSGVNGLRCRKDGEEISATVTKPCLLKSGGRNNLPLPYDLWRLWDYL